VIGYPLRLLPNGSYPIVSPPTSSSHRDVMRDAWFTLEQRVNVKTRRTLWSFFVQIALVIWTTYSFLASVQLERIIFTHWHAKQVLLSVKSIRRGSTTDDDDHQRHRNHIHIPYPISNLQDNSSSISISFQSTYSSSHIKLSLLAANSNQFEREHSCF